MVPDPFVASGNSDQKKRFPKAGVPRWGYGLFGFATGSGLLLISWVRLAGSTDRASLASSRSAFRKIRAGVGSLGTRSETGPKRTLGVQRSFA